MQLSVHSEQGVKGNLSSTGVAELAKRAIYYGQTRQSVLSKTEDAFLEGGTCGEMCGGSLFCWH